MEAWEAPERELVAQEQEGRKVGLGLPLGVMGLSAWMLLMTAMFFHTWFEKFTGLLVAFMGIGVVHFLPRALPALRDVIGMPGF
ncbi:hypothetical protein ABVK25_009600 [Lepraria finkii]|uniref:Uncharacterized protein n=1 Tax=Lepraria finkii TaxID=1340010 RepID=A0ABR4AWQ1_9LECA